jgi:hypothetical protein
MENGAMGNPRFEGPGCYSSNVKNSIIHMIRDTAFWGESVKPSIDSVIRRLVKLGARVEFSPVPPQHHERREASKSSK